jgi:hypothetical protein
MCVHTRAWQPPPAHPDPPPLVTSSLETLHTLSIHNSLSSVLPLLLLCPPRCPQIYAATSEGGARIVAGSVLLQLAAAPGPGCSSLGTYRCIVASLFVTPYIISPHIRMCLVCCCRCSRAIPPPSPLPQITATSEIRAAPASWPAVCCCSWQQPPAPAAAA